VQRQLGHYPINNMLGGGANEGVEIKSRHQRAGVLWKLPMSKSSGERWQRRMFIAKDGFLLYYKDSANPNAANVRT
jgi:hypothetical protein